MRNVRFAVGVLSLWVVWGGSIGCSRQGSLDRYLKRADAYFQKGDLEKAKIEYLNGLRLDRTNGFVLSRLGKIYFDQGAPYQAYPFLVNARPLFPGDLDLRLKLATVYLAGVDRTKARAEAVSILEKSPADEGAIPLLLEASQTEAEIQDAQKRLAHLRQVAGDQAIFHVAAAQLQARGRNPAAAEAEIKRALALDPASRPAHLAMANLFLQQSNFAQADQEFHRAAERTPVRSSVWIRYARFKAETGDSAGAKKILHEILAKAPDYVPANTMLARYALAEQHLDQAQSLVQQALRIEPMNYDARMIRAEILMGNGKASTAADELEGLDRIYPQNPQIKYQLALAHLVNNKPGQAQASLDQAVALDPEFAEAVRLRAELDIRGGNPARAVSSLLSLVRRHPGLVDEQLALADAYSALGRPEDAATIYQNLINTRPTEASAWLRLGLLRRHQKRFDDAHRALEKALEIEPENPMAFEQLVDLEIGSGRIPDAANHVRAQLQKNPKSVTAQFLEGRVFLAQTNFDQAEAALQKTIRLEPNAIPAYYLLATIYSQTHQEAKAIEQLEGVISKKPGEKPALMLLGSIYGAQKEFAKARQMYEKILEIDPSHGPALNNLAYLCSENFNQLDKANELARKARLLRPRDPIVADTLGWILYRRKEFDQALPLLREAAAKHPSNPETQFHLGMVHYMMGQEAPARAALRRSVSAPGLFNGKEEAQRRLAMLEGDGAGESRLSLADLEKTVSDYPGDVIARVRLAAVYEKQGATAKAAKAYEEALKLNPNSLLPLVHLAQLYAGPLANKAKAMELAKRARESAPGDLETAAVLGQIAFEEGEHTWAYGLLRESARGMTNRAEVHYDYGRAAYSLGREGEALQAMQRSLAIDPNSPWAASAKWFLRLAGAAGNPRQFPDGESKLEEFLKTDPENAPGLMLLAGFQAGRGDSKGAAQTYERLLAKSPEFFPAKKQLANWYAQDPSSEGKAYTLAAEAREAMPDDIEVAQTLGRLSYRRKDYVNAARLFQEVSGKMPQDAETFYLLGVSLSQTRDTQRSRQALEKSLANGLTDPHAAEARRLVASLARSP